MSAASNAGALRVTAKSAERMQGEVDEAIARLAGSPAGVVAVTASHRHRSTPKNGAWTQPPRKWSIGKPCPYCGEEMTKRGKRGVTKDHLHPRSKGGLLHGANRVICCWGCNNDKGNSTIERWHARLERAGDPRAGRVATIVAGFGEAAP